jgi:ABC-type glycerol-3-phosphate transport system substrate-binding protein
LLVAVLAGLLVVGMVAAGCGSSSTTPTTPIVGPVTGESI